MYSAIKSAKVTLPSVEGGFGTLNILRDPPKSIQTIYKPKISDTSQLNELIDASDDRICESIKKFARGVNPMVSVSYSNYGTMGGQMRDTIGTSSSNQKLTIGQSYLTHRIARDGAFRPPIVPPEQLLPLSRLPRLPTSAKTNIGSDITLDFKTQTQCSTNLRALREELTKIKADSRAIFNIEKPTENPSETKSCIQEIPLVFSGHTNKSDKIHKIGVNPNPERGIKTDENSLYGSITVNNSRNIQSIQHTTPQPDRGVKDKVLQTPYTTSKCKNIQNIQNTALIPERGVRQSILKAPYIANKSRNIQNVENTILYPERGVKDKVIQTPYETSKSQNIQLIGNSIMNPERGVKVSLLQTPFETNKSQNIQNVNNTVPEPERGIKNAILCSYDTTKSTSIRGTPIENIVGIQPISIQDRAKGSLQTNITGHEKQQYMHDTYELKRNTPVTSIELNKSVQGIDINDKINSRNYTHLPERRSRGEFLNSGFQPVLST